ncbi:SEC-C domain-containing protein [Acinetobacter radioresistens]|uniref:SEC-C domain-containing protein n=1 Tax=Acinetobacter radioresistens TaxID=40216 RepID=UPI002245985F|nr:SEC-C domain-containing protein [Acinetobacter radioresistens]MCX0330215.1 SEC-C domain-containing protein [Acinetobacter radioresistens]
MKPHKTPLTPYLESYSVKALLNKMNIDTQPIYVKSIPNQMDIENECFLLVDENISNHGGERILGWAIWELPGLFIEAEFHAVWKTPEGELIDLNPRPLKTEKILFLPDYEIVYEGYRKNNIRLALSNNPTVNDFLKAHDKIFEFMNKGKRKEQYGEIKLKGNELIEYELLMREMMNIQLKMDTVYKPLGIYDPCVCGSGKKAKWCHKLI